MPTENRHPRRAAKIAFRVSEQERDQLRKEATEAGLNLTQLLELRIFGEARPAGIPGRMPATQVERFDIGA